MSTSRIMPALGGEEIVSEPLTSFELAENELQIDFLSVLLGSLNALGEISAYSNEVLKSLETDIISNLVKGLPRIRQSQIQSLYKKDTSQVVRLQSEREAAKLYINIVL
jgi:hypothetical protein